MNDLSNENIYWWRPLDDKPLDTRGTLLFAAYKEIHCQGFQSASLKNILARTGVTKGALYHHFPNKTALGYAVIDEVIAQRIHASFVQPLQAFDDPIDGIMQLIEGSASLFSLTDIQLGCPLSVLSQEMAPIDEGFRKRLLAIYNLWHKTIADGFQAAQFAGRVRDDIDPYATAITIVSIMEGAIHAAKVAQDLSVLSQCGAGLVQYLQLLRKDQKA